MRILGAVSMGGAGHLNPLLPVLAAARERGNEVLIVAPSSMRAQVPSFADQLANGRRVASAGAGLLVETDPDRDQCMVGERDAARITAAATDVLSLPGYRAAALRIGAAMAAAPRVEDVLGAAT